MAPKRAATDVLLPADVDVDADADADVTAVHDGREDEDEDDDDDDDYMDDDLALFGGQATVASMGADEADATIAQAAAGPVEMPTVYRMRLQPPTPTSDVKPATLTPRKGEHGLFVCTVEGCDRTYSTASHLRRHQKSHLQYKPYRCERCGQTFTLNHHLKYHLRSHTGERPYVCTHPNCDKSYVQPGDYYRHLRKHTGETPYTCEACYKSFIRGRDLINHRRKVHFLISTPPAADGNPPVVGNGPKRIRKAFEGAPSADDAVVKADIATADEPVLLKQTVSPVLTALDADIAAAEAIASVAAAAVAGAATTTAATSCADRV